jgi:hypothetical protein
MLRPTVSRPVSWNEAPIRGSRPDFYYCQTVGVFVDVGRSFWQEDRSIVYNCCWPSPAQLFSGRSPVGLATLFYWLRFETNCKVKVTLRLTVGQSVSKSWCRAPSGAHDQIFITVLQLQPWCCGAPSLRRGRVCLSYILLALASAVFLGVRVPWDSGPYFTVSGLRLPFSSPSTTRRVTVEVFYPTSTRGKLSVIIGF